MRSARAAAGAQRRFEIQPLGRSGDPPIAAKRSATPHTATHGLQFAIGERTVYLSQPTRRRRDRPLRQRLPQRLVSLPPPPQARPTPRFRAGHQIGLQGVTLYIAGDRQKMFVRLDRKRLKSTLVEGAGAGGVGDGRATAECESPSATASLRRAPRPAAATTAGANGWASHNNLTVARRFARPSAAKLFRRPDSPRPFQRGSSGQRPD